MFQHCLAPTNVALSSSSPKHCVRPVPPVGSMGSQFVSSQPPGGVSGFNSSACLRPIKHLSACPMAEAIAVHELFMHSSESLTQRFSPSGTIDFAEPDGDAV